MVTRDSAEPSGAKVWREVEDGLTVALRVQPRARRASVGGVALDGAGGARLKVAVTEPPEDGRATEAVLRALASMLHLAPTRIALLQGAGAREKLVRIEGDPARLAAAIDALASR